VEQTLAITLDREGEIPLGVQLAWALRARILAGDLPRGFRLPGARELAVTTGVNANTVRAVYARLEAEGLVAAEHGRGMFVRADAPQDERVAQLALRALDEAHAAGLNPREVATALYGATGAAPRPDGDAAERRRLRDEIAALEAALSDETLQRRMAALRREPVAPIPAPPRGRVLGAQELRAQRDELAARLELLRATPDAAEAEAEAEAEAAPAASRQSNTRPGPVVRWRPSFGA
jgi:DNA-binding transcriptional regulator YhcF (GntR family)